MPPQRKKSKPGKRKRKNSSKSSNSWEDIEEMLSPKRDTRITDSLNANSWEDIEERMPPKEDTIKPDSLNAMLWELIEDNMDSIVNRIMCSSRWKNAVVDKYESSIRELKDENNELRKRLAIAEGRITRVDIKTDKLTTKTTDLAARSMRDNVLVKNIKEVDEDQNRPEKVAQRVMSFIESELQLQPEELAKINIERAHRMGKRISGRTRHIVVKLNSQGKEIVMRNMKNIREDCEVKICDQYPPEIHANKNKLWKMFKEAKEKGKKPKWRKDELQIDGKVYKAPKEHVTNINMDVSEVASKMKSRHTSVVSKDNSHFQAHSVDITSKDDVIPAITALSADPRVAGATHLMYAYRVGTENYFFHNWEDDGEWGGGRCIMDAITSRGVYNKLICVTRWHNGQNLGKVRFELITDLAREIIDRE